MTGIERLREFAAGISPITAVCGVTKTAYDREHMEVIGVGLRDFLADIADQIEAEQDERVTRRLEDREAAEWVSAHGGLDAVREKWRSMVPRALDEHMAEYQRERRERMQRHIEFVQGKCRERQERICELNRLNRAYRDALNGVCKRLGLTDGTGLPDMTEVIWTELDRRLMPEGMEWLLDVWPKWSNGEYCKFGDWWVSDNYGEPKPKQFRKLSIYTPEQLREWGQDDGDNYGYEWDFVRPSDPKYRPDKSEPPAPKVYDADGVEIRAGEMLFHVMSGDGVTARQLMPPDKFEDTEFIRHFASEYTHRAHVLAADGVPLREGKHVYHVETGAELVVKELPRPGEYQAVVVSAPPASHLTSFDPDQLTHERPDSFEQLEKDANDLIYDIGFHLGDYSPSDFKEDGDSVQDRVRDLVRRAKVLAERGQ